jgi:ubiquitin C-terminal hydrolase
MAFYVNMRSTIPNLEALSDEQIFLNYILHASLFTTSEDRGQQFQISRKFNNRPDELMFTALRVTHTRDSRGQYVEGKINDSLPLPMRMTIPSAFFVEEREAPPTYEADAFFIHLGGGVRSGHYISYKRTEYNGRMLWWKIDDSRVTYVSDAQAADALRTAYNVHYTRVQ